LHECLTMIVLQTDLSDDIFSQVSVVSVHRMLR
jgi:hypothetical protein